MAGSLETVAHAILSPYAVYLYLYMYRCVCTYWVTLKSVQLRNATTTDGGIESGNGERCVCE